MGTKNRISAEITAEQLQVVKDSVAAINKALENVLTINLEPEDRKSLLKMGDKTLAFVEKAFEFANLNTKLVPSFVDFPEAQRDYKLSRDLYGVLQQLTPLVRAVEDVGMVAGSEAYEVALTIYSTAKVASGSNLAGAQAVVEDLSKRYPNSRRKPDPLQPI
jgi:hypothetical protein